MPFQIGSIKGKTIIGLEDIANNKMVGLQA